MIRSYTPDDESAMLSLWNTAGAVMGYAPVPLEDFHRLLTRHPNFSPAYTFVLEEKGTLLGFVNGCTGAGIPKGDIRGYLSCGGRFRRKYGTASLCTGKRLPEGGKDLLRCHIFQSYPPAMDSPRHTGAPAQQRPRRGDGSSAA